ncbi:hypothetical protein [Bacillus alveayuensis]|jgi:hypothetical protein|uniref:Uncharacterized protein n=1 Tax=Aeribacillus alveayuensis TaxID=279215 RepID=A0ABT9VLR5_9BACI|nr:hypothetical protein [Bacillus alveayuensis]MDQ0161810.1 hypothetical protein [Bacillus alveayuensis]
MKNTNWIISVKGYLGEKNIDVPLCAEELGKLIPANTQSQT